MPGHPKRPNLEQTVNDRIDRPAHRLFVVALLLVLAGAWPGTPAPAQSSGELRAWIGRGEIPGPRLLSSLGAVREDTGTPDEIRAYVRDRAAAGADVIKVFASTSIRFGGVTNLSAAQLEAACGEARAQGLTARAASSG